MPEETTTVSDSDATTSIGGGALTRGKELHPHLAGQDGHMYKPDAGHSTAAAVAGPSIASRTILNGMR